MDLARQSRNQDTAREPAAHAFRPELNQGWNRVLVKAEDAGGSKWYSSPGYTEKMANRSAQI